MASGVARMTPGVSPLNTASVVSLYSVSPFCLDLEKKTFRWSLRTDVHAILWNLLPCWVMLQTTEIFSMEVYMKVTRSSHI